MKKHLTWVSFSILIFAAVAFIAFTPQGKDKEKQQHPNQGKKDMKNNPGKGDMKNNPGNNPMKDNNGNNGNRDNNGKNNDRDLDDNRDDRMNKGNNGNNGNKIPEYGYDWDRGKFKDRKKFRNQDKVTVCHKFNRNNDPAVAIRVSSNALKAHLNHGDIIGNCPVISNPRYSDRFLRRRTDYYNDIQQSQEQVLYSRSILDYAVARLADSRSQLAVSQNNNMPQADIAQRQATVMELEENVSLLETLLGVAANLLVNKLQ